MAPHATSERHRTSLMFPGRKIRMADRRAADSLARTRPPARAPAPPRCRCAEAPSPGRVPRAPPPRARRYEYSRPGGGASRSVATEQRSQGPGLRHFRYRAPLHKSKGNIHLSLVPPAACRPSSGCQLLVTVSVVGSVSSLISFMLPSSRSATNLRSTMTGTSSSYRLSTRSILPISSPTCCIMSKNV